MRTPQLLFAETLQATTNAPLDALLSDIEQPRPGLGDLAFKSFRLAKTRGEQPVELATTIAAALEERGWSARTAGPYVNVDIDVANYAHEALPAIMHEGERFGSMPPNDKVAVLDYSAPNIGKPLHVGHIRSTILGDSISRILKFTGYVVHGINYLGDVGGHIGKILAADARWDSDWQDPEKAMLDLYVRFSEQARDNPSLEAEAKDFLKRIEEEDQQVIERLEFIHEQSLKAFDRVYRLLDIAFEETTGQSRFSQRGKEVVHGMLESGLAIREENGGIIVPLEGLPDKAVLRADGTAIYATQDLGAAVSRFEEHGFSSMHYVVAKEQALYFQQLFGILDKAGYDWAGTCNHVSFGMINLPEGRMSTREGKIVYLEEVLDKAVDLAKERLAGRDLADPEATACAIGIGAVKHMVLSVDYERDLDFSWERALDFSGDSAPYVQYGCVRAARLLERGGEPAVTGDHDFSHPLERELLLGAASFPETVARVQQSLKPHHLASYAHSLTKSFSKLYNQVPIIGSEAEADRLALVAAYKTVATNAFRLLGIGVPREM